MIKIFVSLGGIILMIRGLNIGKVFFITSIFIISFFCMFLYFGGGSWRVRYGFCLGEYSFLLILLRMWVIGLIILCLVGGIEEGRERGLKGRVIGGITLILIIFFRARNLLGFYFFFEVRLIPTFFLVYF